MNEVLSTSGGLGTVSFWREISYLGHLCPVYSRTPIIMQVHEIVGSWKFAVHSTVRFIWPETKYLCSYMNGGRYMRILLRWRPRDPGCTSGESGMNDRHCVTVGLWLGRFAIGPSLTNGPVEWNALPLSRRQRYIHDLSFSKPGGYI